MIIFLFGIFFFSFLLTIFLSIINNKFLFVMDNSIITQVRESYIIKSMYEYFAPWVIFWFLSNYDYIINLLIILFIFYKMTIGGVVDYLMAKLLKFLIHFFEEKAGGTSSGDDDHWHDNHWHDDHGDGGHDAHWHDAHGHGYGHH